MCQPLAGFGQGLEKLGPRFDLDLDSYRTTDASQVLYEEVKHLALPIAAPRALAVGPDGTIYAGGAKDVIAFDRAGGAEKRWGFSSPVTALAVGSNGQAYAAAGGAVYRLLRGTGAPEPWTDLGERAVITSIAVSPNRIYLADAGNRVAAVFDPDARLLRFIGRKNKARGIPGLIIPSPYFDVAPAPEGGIWLVNPGRLLVARYTEQGERVSAWGEGGMAIEGFCGCCNPIHIALLPDGGFATSEKGIPRVKRYGPDGAFAGVIAGAETFDKDEDGLDLAADSEGRVYVLDSKRSRVRVYEPKKEERP